MTSSSTSAFSSTSSSTSAPTPASASALEMMPDYTSTSIPSRMNLQQTQRSTSSMNKKNGKKFSDDKQK
jgi:hypothetical protein